VRGGGGKGLFLILATKTEVSMSEDREGRIEVLERGKRGLSGG